MTNSKAGLLASGRHSSFAPTREKTREQTTLARSGEQTVGFAPDTDRVVARHAASLLESEASQTVISDLIGRARIRFENSNPGPAGEVERTRAHYQIIACNTLLEQLQAMADDAKIHDRIEAEQAEHD